MAKIDEFFEEIGEPRYKKRGPKVGSRQPENIIQGDIIKFLTLRKWFVMNMTGNYEQMGVPDLYACHSVHGARWIEIKRAGKYRFTKWQVPIFQKLTEKGIGIWILTAATDYEYKKLFGPPNWWHFLEVMK
jgi:hypothetical protein